MRSLNDNFALKDKKGMPTNTKEINFLTNKYLMLLVF